MRVMSDHGQPRGQNYSATVERTIPAEHAGLRLDQALARLFPEHSRSRLQAWVRAGRVTVDAAQADVKRKVWGGERVALSPSTAAAADRYAPQAIRLEIVHEDDDILVVDKPAGLVVHPGAGNPSGTLLNGLLHHVPALAGLPRAGIIHRIDKETTGLLLVAKTLPAHTALVRALAERVVMRRYVAVCQGVLTGGGTIDAPIGRHPVDRKRMAVQDEGRPAVTRYTVAERFRGHTRVDVALETGRTHQIRVHFAWRRHPLVGDPVYGGRLALPAGASDALIAALREFRRQALHATRLEFPHPDSGEPVCVESPLPPDLEALLRVLREDARCS
jgi:23S rRNA pseudouridine1911/1915/1917 synthase